MHKDAIGTITLNRPQRRNALNAKLMQEIVNALWEMDRDEKVKVIVIKGQGNTFCAGADMEELISGESIMEKRAHKENVSNMIEAIGRIGKLVIAQVDGYALAGGCGLAIACDMVIASETATFGLPEIHRALFPMTIMAPISRSIGWKKGMEWYFVGDNISGKQAAELGLVNYAVPANQLEQKTNELATKVASKSAATLRLGKDAFYAMRDMEYFTALRYLKDMILITTLTEDAKEGVKAFFEKRQPKWIDR
ncbi:MAG: enoyl-CoA hydratase-related protein [Carboxydocellales bacterium]